MKHHVWVTSPIGPFMRDPIVGGPWHLMDPNFGSMMFRPALCGNHFLQEQIFSRLKMQFLDVCEHCLHVSGLSRVHHSGDLVMLPAVRGLMLHCLKCEESFTLRWPLPDQDLRRGVQMMSWVSVAQLGEVPRTVPVATVRLNTSHFTHDRAEVTCACGAKGSIPSEILADMPPRAYWRIDPHWPAPPRPPQVLSPCDCCGTPTLILVCQHCTAIRQQFGVIERVEDRPQFLLK